jgi:hypothetical protein
MAGWRDGGIEEWRDGGTEDRGIQQKGLEVARSGNRERSAAGALTGGIAHPFRR